MGRPASLIFIGLHSERPRSGKSTVGNAIAEAHGGKVYSIAGGIRDMARSLGFHEAADAEGDAKDVPHPDLGDLTPRQVLILIGQSRRKKHGELYWLHRCLRTIQDDAPAVAVIDDVRLLDEGRELVDRSVTVCTITRDGVHDTVDINGWRSGSRYTFANDATPAECAERIWARAMRDRRSAS